VKRIIIIKKKSQKPQPGAHKPLPQPILGISPEIVAQKHQKKKKKRKCSAHAKYAYL